jgi:hypothetical protein
MSKVISGCTNNELVQVVRVLGPLSRWSGVRFVAPAYGKNSVGRGEPMTEISHRQRRWKLRIYIMVTQEIN